MRYLVFIGLVVLPYLASAGKIKKAFGALEIYNYFEAKRLFEKSLKKQECPAAYGLSIIYYRSDNPFHNIDSAYVYVVRAKRAFSVLEPDHQTDLEIYGISGQALDEQRELVSTALFSRAKGVNTIEAYDSFIRDNYWSPRVDSAVFLRDSIAFARADQSGKSVDFTDFIESYPTSVFAEPAMARFNQTIYQETTSSNTLISYLDFVRKYPDSPYRTDAEDRIFEFYTSTGTVESYRKFIEDCPQNHNVNEAWRKLYNAHVQTKSYSQGSLAEFADQYPDYPFMAEVEKEIKLSDMRFFPVKSGDVWGFVNEQGELAIKPQYQDADNFSEGLALVKIQGKYGYINKSGTLVIQPVYDDALPFNEGHAVVEVKDKAGMINRNGEFIVPPRYEDLGNLHNGLAYFLRDTAYGYFDSKGIERIAPKFSDAYDFEHGKAIVALNDYFGLIDVFGTTYIPCKYDELRHYEGDSYLAMFDGYWGLIRINGDTLLGFEYDFIGKTSDNRMMVEKDDQLNYADRNGKLILSVWLETYSEYKALGQFRNGYARIYEGGKYNLMDTTGKRLFTQGRENVGDFSSLIAVSKGGKWGYQNAQGTQVIPFSYTYASSFKNTSAIAGNDPFFGLIGKNGTWLIEPYFEKLEYINDTLFIGKSLGNYGILNIEGDTLLEFAYVSIEPINERFVRLEKGEEVFYFDLVKKAMLRKED